MDVEKQFIEKLHELYSYENVARYIGCSTSTIYKWLKLDKPISRMSRTIIRRKMEERKENGQGTSGNKGK